MDEQIKAAMKLLEDAGYAVACVAPDELGGADPMIVHVAMKMAGWGVIYTS